VEYLSHAVNWLYTTAGILILGSMVISLLCVNAQSETIEAWRQKILKAAIFLALILFITGLSLPPFQAIAIENQSAAAFDLKTLKLVLFSTRFGSVWIVQEAISFLILLSLIFHHPLILRIGYKWFLIGMITLSSLMLLIGSFKSHAAALEPVWPGLLGNSLHVLAAGSWFGALPALILLLRSSAQQNTTFSDHATIEQTLKRFSVLATLMVGVILFSGTFLGYQQVGRWGELFSTPYGIYLISKIVLFVLMLLVASIIRLRYMPRYKNNKPSPLITVAISKWVMLETFIGIALLAVASILKSTTPATHEENIIWPFNFRYSLAGTWEIEPNIKTQAILGLCLIVLSIVIATYLYRIKNSKALAIKALTTKALAIIIGATLSIAGLLISLPPLSVEANPDTYRNSTVPYDSISIKTGEALYRKHCISCHDDEGMGMGDFAMVLEPKPSNFMDMHSGLHTAGDIFWFLKQGLKDEITFNSFALAMLDPAEQKDIKSINSKHIYGNVFDDEELWDLINYLNALSSSHMGSSLGTHIEPEKPFLGAPDFYYSTASKSGNLKDFRQNKASLLVFFSWPEEKERLDFFKENYQQITENNAEIIAITTHGSKSMSSYSASYPFPIITDEAESIIQTYRLFRRSTMLSRDFDNQAPLTHIEFIIDRFGYMRARWIPGTNTASWEDSALLIQQLSELAEEEEILPPPDEHVH